VEMIFQHVCDPCEYLILDNVCSEQELSQCFLEIDLISPAFEGPNKTNSAKHEDGSFKKQNKGIFFEQIYTPSFAFVSPILVQLHKAIKALDSRKYTALSQMNLLSKVSGYNAIINGYKNGDYYESHQDGSALTALFWFAKEDFYGGDLVFTAFNHTVPFKSNRVILFPSYYEHAITEIKSDSENNVRFSVSAFLMIDGLRKHEQPTTVGTNDF